MRSSNLDMWKGMCGPIFSNYNLIEHIKKIWYIATLQADDYSIVLLGIWCHHNTEYTIHPFLCLCLCCINFLPFLLCLSLLPPSGCDMELMEDIKGLTAGVSSRKRGKRRYFWEYSEQLTPSKQERMLKPSEWDRHTLPSNLYQKNGPLHGTHTCTTICACRHY